MSELEPPSKKPKADVKLHDLKKVPLKIVLTGGPCAGKTTCLRRLAEHLASRGVRAFAVPEVPTLFVTGGASFEDLDTDEKLLKFQETQLRTQIFLEDEHANLASLCQAPTVLLMDRGVVDGAAYVSPEQWRCVLKRTGYSSETDSGWGHRYAVVIHLVSTAVGAEEFYSTQGHESRFENLQEAKETEMKTRQAWVSHPDVRLVDNSTDFEGKVRRVIEIVEKVLEL